MTCAVLLVRRGGALGLYLVTVSGCIIPDSEISVQDEFLNLHAVRIVEPSPVTERADSDCRERTSLSGCPRVPDTLPSGLISPGFALCVCQEGERDLGLGFDVFVEDADIDGQGDPTDDIIGALFLDMPDQPEDPRDFLAYTNHLPPEEPARRFRASDVQTIERPDPHLKAWTLGDQSRVDLCNDHDSPKDEFDGLHELRLIVTDRPWYRPALVDADGNAILDDNGLPSFADPVVGMPDLAAGATYDTASYVFQCFDASDPPEGVECNCEA
ncbi:MAG: hypothetical protein K0V04_17885 [Deltaproteobacteria bacterium]|nr:hypothetical protein [Deltaproteobacteria bacterium]